MLQVTVKISGSKEVQQKIAKLGKSFYMFKSAMDDIGKEVSNYYENTGFASQGGVFGARWAPLNMQYAKRKFMRYPGRSPLVASGTMQKSFAHKATETSVTIGNTADYFKYHQSSEPRTKMPRRVTMGINSAVRQMVKDIIDADVHSKIKQAGL